MLQEDGDEIDIFEDENPRAYNQSRMNFGGAKPTASGERMMNDYYDQYEGQLNSRGGRYEEPNYERSRNSARPKTSNRKNYSVDSSYYLDDPNI